MDNNLAEQAIRPFTVGRKNWVFIATPKGAKASAILYSLVETAKATIYDYWIILNIFFRRWQSTRRMNTTHTFRIFYLGPKKSKRNSG